LISTVRRWGSLAQADAEEEPLGLEPGDTVNHATNAERVVAGGRRRPHAELEPADLTRPDVARGGGREPARRDPSRGEIRARAIEWRARAQAGLLIGDARVPAAVARVRERDDERRRRARR